MSRTTGAAKLLTFAETALNPATYADLKLDDQAYDSAFGVSLADVLARKQWVETLVVSLERLVALSVSFKLRVTATHRLLHQQPKRKHPHLLPVTRLLTAPLDLSPTTTPFFIPGLLTQLIAIPALPQSLPIPALTHLSQRLPLFTHILPAAANDPSLLFQGRLSVELGRTYFLANIATFAITGGMLARFGVQGAETWVKVVATLLGGVEEGWGRWAEGIVDDEDDPMDIMNQDGDSDDEGAASVPKPISKRRKQTRPPLPTNISSRLLLLGSTAHIATLADLLVSPTAASTTSMLVQFASFTLALLNAFKGTARWESILDSLLEGRKGLALTRRLWREGVRGKWSTDRDAGSWQSFSMSTCQTYLCSRSATAADSPDHTTPCLILLTHLHCHYLLLTPDDEFFTDNNTSNPFSIDEVLELGAIWRDLAFWGYMEGVSSPSQASPDDHRGDEDTRALFTKGVTRLAARK